MRPRPGESPQRSGRRFEKFFAKVMGVEPQKGSGNTWFAKLDVADGSITWSLKFTSHESISISKALLREADNAIHQNGDNSIPGIAAAIDNGSEVIIAMRYADFVRLLSTNSGSYITPTRGEQKRSRAGIPGILREQD